MRDADVRRDVGLEARDVGAAGEPAGLDDPAKVLGDVGEVDERPGQGDHARQEPTAECQAYVRCEALAQRRAATGPRSASTW